MQAVQVDGRVMDFAHGILVVVHTLEIARGVALQEGLDGLDHVAEVLEGDAHVVNRRRIAVVQLSESLERPGVGLIHGLQQLGQQVFIVGMLLCDLAQRFDTRLQV